MAKITPLSSPPPASLEVEQSVIGSILIQPQVMDLVVDILTPQDFYREAHRKIYQAMLDLYNRHGPMDLPLLNNLLKERGQLEEVGGPVFLMGLSDHVGATANADNYARIVWEKAQIRKIQEKAKQILHENPNGNFGEFVTWAESQILEVTTPALDRNRASSLPPIKTSTLTPISECLENPPPPRDFLFDEVLPSGIVAGVIAVGGTGKGLFLIMAALGLATGRKIGPLQPTRKFKVLYLAGEDDQEELRRRTISTIEALWPEGPPPEIDNFIPVSVMGELGPLMQLDGAGNPINAPAYDWLCKTLQNLPEIDVLIIDPKSKFYGLVENDNGHNAAWVNCLESLTARFKITIPFSHHESKAKAGSMDQGSSRGGSALTDGCRWVANIKTMDPKTAEKYQISEPHNYVVLDVTKSNYAPKLPGPVYFRRVSGGALIHVDLATERAKTLALKLVELLETQIETFSRNDLIYEKRAKEIADELKEAVEGFRRVKDINLAVDYALRAGWIIEARQISTRGRGKSVLKVNVAGQT